MKKALLTKARLTLWKPLFLAGCLLTLASCQTDKHSMLAAGSIDTPLGGSTVSKVTPVMGWAFSEDGIEGVSIYLDRRFVLEAKTGLPRPDLKKVFPNVPDAGNLAWEADLKLDGVTAGTHTITANVRSKNGSTVSFSVSMNVQ